jgi:hypothetical protein
MLSTKPRIINDQPFQTISWVPRIVLGDGKKVELYIRNANYTKHDNVAFCTFDIEIIEMSRTSDYMATVQMGGLPIVSLADRMGHVGAVSIAYYADTRINLPGLSGIVKSGVQTADLLYATIAGGPLEVLSRQCIQEGTRLSGTIMYTTNS